MGRYESGVIRARKEGLSALVSNWAALHNIRVQQIAGATPTINYSCLKEYKIGREFSFGLFALWGGLGFLIGVVLAIANGEAAWLLLSIVLPIVYVMYFLWRGHSHTVWFEISMSKGNGDWLKISASSNSALVRQDIADLMLSLTSQ